MRSLIPKVLLIVLPNLVFAQQQRLAFGDGALILEALGPAHSDDTYLTVRIQTRDGSVAAEIPAVRGPVYASSANRQILACESNAAAKTASAKVFGENGSLVFSSEHVGYLRGCGVTGDERLYWLHYNLVSDGVPKNVVVVLDSVGNIVVREEFEEEKTLQFDYNGFEYVVAIPEAEWPG